MSSPIAKIIPPTPATPILTIPSQKTSTLEAKITISYMPIAPPTIFNPFSTPFKPLTIIANLS